MTRNESTTRLNDLLGDSSWAQGGAGAALTAGLEGRVEDVESLGLAGATLRGLTSGQASHAVLTLLDAADLRPPGPAHNREWYLLSPSAMSKASEAHHGWLGKRQAEVWRAWVDWGLPVAIFPAPSRTREKPKGELRLHHRLRLRSANCSKTLGLEAARGGLVSESCIELWCWMQMTASAGGTDGGMMRADFGGADPMDYAVAKGLDVAKIPKLSLSDTLAYFSEGSGVDGLLASLSKHGARLVGAESLVEGYNGKSESALGALLHLGMSAGAVPHAAKIGLDLFAVDDKGASALSSLFALNRVGGYADRAAALIKAADAAQAGGGSKLLAMKGKDGAGPMHWAARALSPESVSMLSGMGLDVNERDAKGKSPGHWVAKKYGAKTAMKVGARGDAGPGGLGAQRVGGPRQARRGGEILGREHLDKPRDRGVGPDEGLVKKVQALMRLV